MNEQPVPEVSQADVERVVIRDFGSASAPGVHAVLAEYGTESWHPEVVRVRLAILKLADGDVRRLRSATDTANLDYRDVLAPAESPGYLRRSEREVSELSEAERRAVVDGDWEQYRAWLSR